MKYSVNAKRSVLSNDYEILMNNFVESILQKRSSLLLILEQKCLVKGLLPLLFYIMHLTRFF